MICPKYLYSTEFPGRCSKFMSRLRFEKHGPKVHGWPSAWLPELGEIWLQPSCLTSFNPILMTPVPSQPSLQHAHSSLLTFPWLLQFLPHILPFPDETAVILQAPDSSLFPSLLLLTSCFNFTLHYASKN